MNEINVLHVIVGGEINGGERYLLSIIDNMSRDNYRLFFICSEEQKNLLQELGKRNLETLPLNMQSKFRINTLFQIRNFIRAKKIRIVHTHGTRVSFYGRLAARWAGVPIIISTVHSSLYNYPIGRMKKKMYTYLDRLTAHFCDQIICVSRALADEMVKRSKINPGKILIIRNGVDLKRFDQIGDTAYLLKESNTNSEDKKIGAIGRLSHEKGHACLLKAVARLKKSFPRLKCLIVGDGPLRQELERLSRELGISQNCIFLGARRDIAEILSILDLLVLPSLSEGLSMALLESMASRCPAVASRVGGIPELIEDGKTGLLVEPENPLALAEAIRSLLQNKDKAKEISLNARRRVEKEFTVEEMAKKTEGIYERFVKEKIGT